MELTKRTDFTNGTGAPRYGCYNRPPLKDKAWVPDHIEYSPWTDGNNQRTGHSMQEVRVFKQIPFRMSTACQYDQQATDARCAGCKHIQTEI